MGILDVILGPVTELVDKFVPDADKRMEAKLELARIADQEAQRASDERIAQTEVNREEARSTSLFVAGWRPAIGWLCGIGFLYNIVIAPWFHLGVAEPALLRDVLLGMLGISVGARSIEKIKGVAQNTLTGTETKVTPIATPQVDTQVPKKKSVVKKVGDALWPF